MKIQFYQIVLLTILISVNSCQEKKESHQTEVVEPTITKLAPTIITDKVPNDSDDPAIWIHPTDLSKSLILGNDKEENGGIYAFDLNGKIVTEKTVSPVQRPNNIDVAKDFVMGNDTFDIAVFTERFTESIRVLKLPEMTYIDNGGIKVFVGEEGVEFRAPMGIALFEDPQTGEVSAIVSRKNGPSDGYLWQYRLKDSGEAVTGELSRKFGKYSGNGEIEAIAIDDQLGYVYYSDEALGINKYHAHPDSSNSRLTIFGKDNFTEDREGIAIWAMDDEKGYLLISDQQNHSFEIYTREGVTGNPHAHQRLGEIYMSTIETDGCDIYPDSLSPQFPNGLFIAMSEGGVFHYYDARQILDEIHKMR